MSSKNRVLIFFMPRSIATKKIPDLSTEKEGNCTRSSPSSNYTLKKSTKGSKRLTHYFTDVAKSKENKQFYGV